MLDQGVYGAHQAIDVDGKVHMVLAGQPKCFLCLCRVVCRGHAVPRHVSPFEQAEGSGLQNWMLRKHS